MSTLIRRNVAHVSQAERDKLINAIVQADMTKLFPDGVSYWDKQDQIHQATHVHGGPSFLSWHRELVNRFEALLQEVDSTVALHYWDWTTDPRNSPDGQGGFVDLFTSSNFGSSSGRADVPFDSLDNAGVFAGSRDQTGDPADPPQEITRNVSPGNPPAQSDNAIITSADMLPQAQQWTQLRQVIEQSPNHNSIHPYIGGTIGSAHSAFEDPFVFLLHANADRLWAMWQTVPGNEWRLDPDQTYADETSDPVILENLEPWAGGSGLRPWAPPENQQVIKNSRHPTVVKPPCYDTLPFSVELTTPATLGAPITFNDIPEGAMAVRAAVFLVKGCRSLTFTVTSGPAAPFSIFSTLPLPPTTPSDQLEAEARVWFAYTGSSAGDVANSSVTIRCQETEQEWIIPITANTIPWPTVASLLVLDKSGSMDWASGISGKRRMDVLHDAAPIFVELMPNNDALGIVSFDHNAYPVMGVTTAGPPVIGMGRSTANTEIGNLEPNPAGATSIGDGVFLASNTLAPVGGFDHKAIVVFTDGHENSSRYLSDPDVQAVINDRVFAIGLGTAANLNPSALDAIANSTGGFLMMTGAIGNDDLLRLHKYFLQVLAGVTNTAVVVDPEGSIRPGQEHRIPFHLSEADIGADVVLLSPAPWAIEFMLETPSGKVINAIDSASIPNITFVNGTQVHYYRMTLPVPVADGEHAGTWYAILKVDEGQFKEYLSTFRQRENSTELRRAIAHGVPYSLNVQSRSNLTMQVQVIQSGYEPGAAVTLRALLKEYEQPVEQRARVKVAVERPDGTATTIVLAEIEAGVFEAAFTAALPGIYQLVFRANGETWYGRPFTREELRTAAVWRGGDNPPPTTATDPSAQDERFCKLINCILKDKGVVEFLHRHEIDAKQLARCLQQICRVRPDGAAGLRTVRHGQVASPVLAELRSVLGETKADEFLAMIDKLTG